MWDVKNGTVELIYKISSITDVENKLVATRGKGGTDKLGDWG